MVFGFDIRSYVCIESLALSFLLDFVVLRLDWKLLDLLNRIAITAQYKCMMQQ